MMHRSLFRWALVLSACAFLGCGSATGIQSGIPADANATPVNPTDDMGPDPKSVKKK